MTYCTINNDGTITPAPRTLADERGRVHYHPPGGMYATAGYLPRAWHRAHVADRAELEARLTEATESMRVVANLFSASVWRILPDKIKAYFEEYRGTGV